MEEQRWIPLIEQLYFDRFNGRMTEEEIVEKYGGEFIDEPCDCSCHNPENDVIHFQACCNNGIIRKYKPKV